jgi:hypothetical protein
MRSCQLKVMSSIGIEVKNLNRKFDRSYCISMTKRNFIVSIGGPRFLKRKKTNFCYFGRKGISRDCCRKEKPPVMRFQMYTCIYANVFDGSRGYAVPERSFGTIAGSYEGGSSPPSLPEDFPGLGGSPPPPFR